MKTSLGLNMLSNFLKGHLMALFLVWPTEASAADQGQFTFLDKGERAPFRATCFDDFAIGKVVTWKEFLGKEFEIKHELETEKLKAQHALEVQNLQISLDVLQDKYNVGVETRDKEIEELRSIISKQKKLNIPLIVTGSVLGGVAVGFASAYAIDNLLSR